MAINSIYTLNGMAVEYISNAKAYKHMLKAKKYVSRAKVKSGVIVHQWPIGKSTSTIKRTRTMLCVRGAYVDGINMGDIYIKEANL